MACVSCERLVPGLRPGDEARQPPCQQRSTLAPSRCGDSELSLLYCAAKKTQEIPFARVPDSVDPARLAWRALWWHGRCYQVRSEVLATDLGKRIEQFRARLVDWSVCYVFVTLVTFLCSLVGTASAVIRSRCVRLEGITRAVPSSLMSDN